MRGSCAFHPIRCLGVARIFLTVPHSATALGLHYSCHFTHRFAKLDAYLCKCTPRTSTLSLSSTNGSVYRPVFLRLYNRGRFAKLCFRIALRAKPCFPS